MADLPITLDAPLAEQLSRVLDPERKIPRALDALGPVADRDVVLVGGGDLRAGQLTDAGARVSAVDWDAERLPVGDRSADAVVGCWSVFRGVDAAEQAEVDRVLRPGGRLLVVHDYGRDDVSALRGDLPEYGAWGRRDGPYLAAGFRMRVLHCWWTFADLDAARSFLGDAFGAGGLTLADGLRRPRLSYNVAIYHRGRPETAAS
jgi:SAM-dependent methyltransferase